MRYSHNVFHVSILKKYNLPENGETISINIDKDGQKEDVVFRNLDKKRENRKRHNLVQLYGDEEHDAIWMLKSKLGISKNCSPHTTKVIQRY